METSRFPCKRLLRMPGSTTTRGRRVSCGIDTRRVAFCGTENISTPNLSYAAQYLACALPCERFTSALTGIPCITRGRCGSLLLHRDGLPPSTSCRSPGAPVHTWPMCDPARLARPRSGYRGTAAIILAGASQGIGLARRSSRLLAGGEARVLHSPSLLVREHIGRPDPRINQDRRVASPCNGP
jgi:hypothetical protein